MNDSAPGSRANRSFDIIRNARNSGLGAACTAAIVGSASVGLASVSPSSSSASTLDTPSSLQSVAASPRPSTALSKRNPGP